MQCCSRLFSRTCFRSGKDFAMIREHLPEHFRKLILGANVFARMGPDQKALLIEDLKEQV
jgi:magnesium-transporting ATPase (P-type)